LPKFDVCVVGEINLDLILYGLPEALSSERELLANGSMLTLGSSSAIFAHNLSAIGARVGFVTRVGADPLGQIALERLKDAGVDLKRVVHARGKTATGVTIVLPHAKTRHIFTYPGAMFEMTYRDLDLKYLASARHFHMSSFFLHRGLKDRIPELFHRMKKAGLSTSLDTNDDPDDTWNGVLQETLKHVDVLLPNERESCKIVGTPDSDVAMARLAQTVPIVVVKQGPQGAVAVTRGRTATTRAIDVSAVDPVGAGDSFDAGFIYQYLRGADLETCLAWGNMAGAFSTTRPGGTEAFRNRAAWKRFVVKNRRRKRTAARSNS
jgi:sugar/nucleoside kinase (ribokinase family)